MKFLSRSITGLGLTLAVPAPTHAQTMAPDKLVGTWAYVSYNPEGDYPSEHFWTFHADGTMTERVKSSPPGRKPYFTDEPVIQWRLAGDSLQLKLSNQGREYYNYKIVAQDQGKNFLMRSLKKGSDECTPFKFERVDTTQPRPAPMPPRATTLKEADLVGTWLLPQTGQDGSEVDTLILRSDSTWTGKLWSPQERGIGGWRLFPGTYGDHFVLHGMNSVNGRLYWRATLQDGGKELVLKWEEGGFDNAKTCTGGGQDVAPNIWKRATP